MRKKYLRILLIIAVAVVFYQCGKASGTGEGGLSSPTNAVEERNVLTEISSDPQPSEAPVPTDAAPESSVITPEVQEQPEDTRFETGEDTGNPEDAEEAFEFKLSEVPPFEGNPYVALNNFIPLFTEEEKNTEAFEYYSELDKLGRCGVAYANICPELMPSEKRGNIGQIKPTGWHTVKYNDLIEGNYLYNRCHLIGYQLAGENANVLNLITGTRYMNIVGMLHFENMVESYVNATGNHVLYRVTPVFSGDDLVVRGVTMEGWSVEDNGAGICFYAFLYNVQPGIVIDYETGESEREEPEADVTEGLEEEAPEPTQAPITVGDYEVSKISLTDDMKYADFSVIKDGQATLYRNTGGTHGDIVICVNAGHGTKGGTNVKTYCHPDKTEKVTGGTTAAGNTRAVAVSSGMSFSDGTAESRVNLKVALFLRDKLLAAGYSVLMIREDDDVQLDNVARTVLANNYADCHIAIHFDSTESNKGAFFMSVPNVKSYRSMEPVASTWERSHALGQAVIDGLRENGTKIYGDGRMAMDLTQTSFSSIPSIDIELGDKKTDHSDSALSSLAEGLLLGIRKYFE